MRKRTKYDPTAAERGRRYRRRKGARSVFTAPLSAGSCPPDLLPLAIYREAGRKRQARYRARKRAERLAAERVAQFKLPLFRCHASGDGNPGL